MSELLKKVEQVTILTIYDKKESKSYLMRDWEKFGDKAKVIKHIKYDRPPVVIIGELNKEVDNGTTNE